MTDIHDVQVSAIDKDIKQAIQRLTSVFQTKEKILGIVEHLYQKYIIPTYCQSVNSQYNSKCSQSQQNFNIQQFDNKVIEIPSQKGNDSQPTKYIIQAVAYPLTFQTQMDEMEFYEKKIAAQTFLRWGYSYHVYRDEIRRRGGFFEISQNTYKRISNTFITDVYRKIEEFLEINCQYQIKRVFPLRGIEVYSVLFNCRKYFEKDAIIAFFKFIALLFEESCDFIEITYEQVITFYEKSQHLMKQKIDNNQRTSLNPDHKAKPRRGKSQMSVISNHQPQYQSNEQRIIAIYIETPSIPEVKERFTNLYGYLADYNTANQIKGVVFKQIRKAMKFLQEYYREHYMILPKLKEINDKWMVKILTKPRSEFLRVRLLRLARTKQVNINALEDTINEVNRFMENQERDDQQQKNKQAVTMQFQADDL